MGDLCVGGRGVYAYTQPLVACHFSDTRVHSTVCTTPTHTSTHIYHTQTHYAQLVNTHTVTHTQADQLILWVRIIVCQAVTTQGNREPDLGTQSGSHQKA